MIRWSMKRDFFDQHKLGVGKCHRDPRSVSNGISRRHHQVGRASFPLRSPASCYLGSLGRFAQSGDRLDAKNKQDADEATKNYVGQSLSSRGSGLTDDDENDRRAGATDAKAHHITAKSNKS